MNDSEIRQRLQQAVGEVAYPQDLPHRLRAELRQPQARNAQTRLLGFSAAILALAIVAALVGSRVWATRTYQPRPMPAASPAASPVAVATPVADPTWIPADDLAGAQLTGHGVLVQPLHLTADNASGRIELLGAYADPARTVLFFRTAVAMRAVQASIDDDYGLLNYGGTGNPGAPGDYVFILNGGPRPGVDGVAHLKISAGPAGVGATGPGAWNFSANVTVQRGQGVYAGPTQINLGSWRVTLEAIGLTPSVLYVRALVEGATIDELGQNFVTAVDSSGLALPEVAGEASVTVPKQQLNASTVKNTRINYQWRGPTSPGIYQLKFQGNGAQQAIRLDLSMMDVPPKGLGLGPKPTDFPTAPESLSLQGSLNANISTGRPSACGAATGPGGTIFAFGLYFQAGGNWYWLYVGTDYPKQQYKGVGTYSVPANLTAVGPNGPGQDLYKGTAQLVVESQQDGHYTGSVNGTLHAVDLTQSDVSASGTWTCTFGPNLGPA